MKYIIIASGYNCAELATKCIESLNKIEFAGEWKAYVCSDGSTDETENVIYNFFSKKGNIHGYLCKENKGAACRRNEMIAYAKPDDEDVIIFLGLDDELLPNALTIIDEQYRNRKWMTYGNWIDQNGSGLPRKFSLEFDEEVHRFRNYRQDVYRSTAPNTFKYFLYKRIPTEDLKINGEWINSTTESEVMFSCLEMCGKEKIGVIRERIYLYNRNLPNGSLERLGKEHKYDLLKIIKERPKRAQLHRPDSYYSR